MFLYSQSDHTEEYLHLTAQKFLLQAFGACVDTKMCLSTKRETLSAKSLSVLCYSTLALILQQPGGFQS